MQIRTSHPSLPHFRVAIGVLSSAGPRRGLIVLLSCGPCFNGAASIAASPWPSVRRCFIVALSFSLSATSITQRVGGGVGAVGVDGDGDAWWMVMVKAKPSD